MNKREVKKLLADIKKHKDAIAKHRDALRDIYDDLEAIVESTTDGLDQIEYGIEAMSQYV